MRVNSLVKYRPAFRRHHDTSRRSTARIGEEAVHPPHDFIRRRRIDRIQADRLVATILQPHLCRIAVSEKACSVSSKSVAKASTPSSGHTVVWPSCCRLGGLSGVRLRQLLRNRLRALRLAEQIALSFLTTQFRKDLSLFFSFDTFGDEP